MFDFSVLFWYKLVFAAELYIIEILFTLRLKKRNRFALRFILSSLAYFAVSFLIPVPWYNGLYVTGMFLLIFALSLVALKVSYDESWMNIIFCGVAAYAAQHVAYSLYSLIMAVTKIDGGAASSIYTEGGSGSWNFFTALIYAECYMFVYAISWYLFGRTLVGNGEIYIENMALMLVASVIIVIAIVINAFVVYYEGDGRDALLIVSNLYGMLSCMLALMLQFSLKKRKKLEGELSVVGQLWQKDKEHYQLAKETIRMINIKCHDLKHQIRAVRIGQTDESALIELENSVEIYDSVVKTGNDALDVLLTEKSLYCERHSIRLTCMADGKLLSFMSPAEIYSLFGNALDNAVEHVCGYEDKAKRFIRLTVRGVGDVLAVHIENYFDGEIKLGSNGLPLTTKPDKDNHGYGMISMKIICEKYGGEIFAKASKNLYMLDMVIPLRGNG